MNTTIASSYKQLQRISKSLNIQIPYMNPNNYNYLPMKSIRELTESTSILLPVDTINKSMHDITYSASFESYFENIKSLSLMTASVRNPFSNMGWINELTRSLNEFRNMPDFKINQRSFSQIYDNASITIRSFSTRNNHINLQWKEMINTQLNDQFITKFMDTTNTAKVSSALGISEENLKRMQDAINETYKNDSAGISENYSYEVGQTNNDLNQVENNSNDISNNQKSSHSISPIFFIWLIIFLTPPALTLDGIIEGNNQEVAVGSLLDLTVGAYERAKSELK